MRPCWLLATVERPSPSPFSGALAMATLARVDVDPVDLPYLKLDNEHSHVGARPSREFSAVTDPTLELPPPESRGWLGKTLFVSAMVAIIAAASVTAVRENAEEPWLAPWLYSAKRILPPVT